MWHTSDSCKNFTGTPLVFVKLASNESSARHQPPVVSWPRNKRMSTEVIEDDLEAVNLSQDLDQDEQLRIEAWLDEHPKFFQGYLIRKGEIDLILLQHHHHFFKLMVKCLSHACGQL